MEPIEVLFFGTPDFAVPALRALVRENRIKVTAVISQPDQAKDRGQKVSSPPVAIVARELGIPVFQPPSLRKICWGGENAPHSDEKDPAYQDLIAFLKSSKNIKPDFLAVVAYGKLIPDDLLAYPKKDSLNVHPSLLPRWRGAAPLQHTLLAGDSNTGVCIIRLEHELDAGPIFLEKEIEISSDVYLKDLHDSLADLGGSLLRDAILGIADNQLSPRPQKSEGLTYARKWEKEDSIIRWEQTGRETINRIRAASPRPGARTLLEGKEFKIIKAILLKEDSLSIFPEDRLPGLFINRPNNTPVIYCGDRSLIEPVEVQLAGKKSMLFKDFTRGFTIQNRLRLGT